MSDNIKKLSDARAKKGWSMEEIEDFANRRSKELKEIAENSKEPDCLASGTQLSNKDKNDD